MYWFSTTGCGPQEDIVPHQWSKSAWEHQCWLVTVQAVYVSPHLYWESGRITWPLWLQEKTKDAALHLLVVYIHLLVLKSRGLFLNEGLMTSVRELRGLAGMRCSGNVRAYRRLLRNWRTDEVASLRTTLTSKELSEPETETVNCTSLVWHIHGLVSKNYYYAALNALKPVLVISYDRSNGILYICFACFKRKECAHVPGWTPDVHC